MEDVLRMGTEEANHELALFNNGDAQSSDSSDDAQFSLTARAQSTSKTKDSKKSKLKENKKAIDGVEINSHPHSDRAINPNSENSSSLMKKGSSNKKFRGSHRMSQISVTVRSSSR